MNFPLFNEIVARHADKYTRLVNAEGISAVWSSAIAELHNHIEGHNSLCLYIAKLYKHNPDLAEHMKDDFMYSPAEISKQLGFEATMNSLDRKLEALGV